jgi:hypothetical protein
MKMQVWKKKMTMKELDDDSVDDDDDDDDDEYDDSDDYCSICLSNTSTSSTKY